MSLKERGSRKGPFGDLSEGPDARLPFPKAPTSVPFSSMQKYSFCTEESRGKDSNFKVGWEIPQKLSYKTSVLQTHHHVLCAS